MADCQGKVTSALRRAYLGCKQVAHSKCVDERTSRPYSLVATRELILAVFMSMAHRNNRRSEVDRLAYQTVDG